MSTRRMIRVNELLRREIGGILYRVMHEQGFDLSAVTVTHVVTSQDLRKALVLVSIRNHFKQRDDMLALLKKHRGEIQKMISKNVILKYTPRLTFALDTSLEKGDRVLNILRGIEEEGIGGDEKGSGTGNE